VNETLNKTILKPDGWLPTVQEWLVTHRPMLVWIVIGLLALLMVRSLARRLLRQVCRSRPPRIHPSLAKYSVDHTEVDRHRRKQAQQILATSTGSRLVGYKILRQVEAVFVEGFRTPEEALTAIKSDAADRGANALINVRTERTTAGRCTAGADAVVVVPLAAHSRPDATNARPKT